MACQRIQALFDFYRVKEDSIEIVRVSYGAQDIQNLLDRES
jgi:plasmid stabilization system protein ParE